MGNIREVEIKVEICREGVVLPEYARQGDAGMDVCAAAEVMIAPGETVIIPTGLRMAIPEGYEIQVRPRSGISLKTPLRLSNSPGTIDSGYRNEIGIIITNSSCMCCVAADDGSGDTYHTGSKACETKIYTIDTPGNAKGTYRIRKGDRVAQLVLQEVPRIKLMQVGSVENIGEDRGGGFGSTGVR